MESAAVGSSGFGASSRCKPGEVAWLVPDPDSSWRRISYWFDNLPGPVTPRQPLPGDLEADVVIVGAGYTGMWTAYYLSAIDPGLRVAVLEREVAGYGASGRNGGWCSAFFAVSPESLTKSYGLDAMGAMQRAMQHSVDEVGAAAAAEGINCAYRKGGTASLARSAAQLASYKADLDGYRALGIGDDDVVWCDAEGATDLVNATGVLGGLFTPHCASLDPARLARGLAETIEGRGVRIYEQTAVTRVQPAGPNGASQRIETPHGRVRAPVVVIATEGYTAQLPDRRRRVVPVYSLMVATEPLDDSTLSEIGIRDGITFTDGRHLLIYGQRTPDGRLAFGGRGAPYHFRSQIDDSFDRVPKVHETLGETLGEMFPVLEGVAITHRWGGPLGVHRDWHPSVNFDRRTGVGSAGGYVGDGVSTANLAGRTLADLICGRDTELTRLPWVNHRSPLWEPEPLRWLGVNSGLVAMGQADRTEAKTGNPSRLAGVVARLTGY